VGCIFQLNRKSSTSLSQSNSPSLMAQHEIIQPPVISLSGNSSSSSLSVSSSGSIDSFTSKRMKPSSSNYTKKLFSDCALVEIIHLHDCLRGALNQISDDVDRLVANASHIQDPIISNLSSTVRDSPRALASSKFDEEMCADLSCSIASRFHLIWSVFQAHSGAEDEFIWPELKRKMGEKSKKVLEQTEYEDDHEQEKKMFLEINKTLTRLKGAFRMYEVSKGSALNSTASVSSALKAGGPKGPDILLIIRRVIFLLKEETNSLAVHLEEHLGKEETECLPMVKSVLSNDEIASLVGNIMGQRSAETMAKILNLAVSSLPVEERKDMVSHMKVAMKDTFFEHWLEMVGWSEHDVESIECNDDVDASNSCVNQTQTCPKGHISRSCSSNSLSRKRKYSDASCGHTCHVNNKNACGTIQINKNSQSQCLNPRDARLRYPSMYYTADKRGKISLVWSRSTSDNSEPPSIVPQFTQADLTPSYHFSESKGRLVYGCEHYARSCKLRHPITGQLFTCRLCCEEKREANNYDDGMLPVLDRYDVSEVLCMRCSALQPSGSKCINPNCESKGASFAKYFCNICNLQDDAENKNIFHCPYCNVCRKGKGLGIDFHHCMRCNACIAVSEYDSHVCISQRLQGECPICQEAMFESTEPLRGMSCGHVMHLSCFKQYIARGSRGAIACPICKKVADYRG